MYETTDSWTGIRFFSVEESVHVDEEYFFFFFWGYAKSVKEKKIVLDQKTSSSHTLKLYFED